VQVRKGGLDDPRVGARRLSLQRGWREYFGPAVALYRRQGRLDCAPFADYVSDPSRLFMTLALE
jgi:putative acetyltransferase